MRKLFSMGVFFLAIALSVAANASIIDIPVTPAGDQVNYRSWWYGGNYTWSDASANPNSVSHSYEPGNGNTSETALSFDLTSFAVPVSDITSASLNYDVLSIWTLDGRDNVSNLNGIGTVYLSGGIGTKYFDITDSFKTTLSGGSTTANYYFSYTGYSGFTFGSADGGDPAYLRIVTTGIDPQIDPQPGTAVPEPATMTLLGFGLVGLVGVRRYKK